LGQPPNYKLGLPALPAAAPLPKGPADYQAAQLASEVAGGGPESLPALLTALASSGIAVRAATGSLLRPASSPEQGIVIDQGYVEVLEMLAQNDVLVPLTSFANALGGVIPALKAAPVAADILDGLRADAVSQRPQVRFLARFVVSLVADTGYNPSNILTDSNPATVTIDGVAMNLITLRLAADLNGLLAGGKPAVVHSHLQLPQGSSAGPCNLNESESTIMDGAANVITTAYDKLMEYLHEHQVNTGVLGGKLQGSVNVLFALAKMYAYLAWTKVELSVSPGPPLVRTKSQQRPGAMTVLTVHQFVDLHKYAQMINCFRIMLNPLGLDMSVPTSGDVAGANPVFECWQGCSTGLVNQGTFNKGFVEFTRADPNDPSTADPQHQRTNGNGKASIGIEGQTQPDKVPDNAQPVKKMAEFVVRMQLKAPSMSQDLVDAIPGASIGFATVANAFLETLLRTNLLKFATYWLPVIDWNVDLGPYSGTFNLTYTSQGVTGTMSGKANFDTPSTPNADMYTLTSGSVTYDVHGTIGTGRDACKEEGSGTVGLTPHNVAAKLELGGVGSGIYGLAPGHYYLFIGDEPGAAKVQLVLPVTITCPTGTEQSTASPAYLLLTSTSEAAPNGDLSTLKGSYDLPGGVKYTWDLVSNSGCAGASPPPSTNVC
jgi:hypothetical protein